MISKAWKHTERFFLAIDRKEIEQLHIRNVCENGNKYSKITEDQKKSYVFQKFGSVCLYRSAIFANTMLLSYETYALDTKLLSGVGLGLTIIANLCNVILYSRNIKKNKQIEDMLDSGNKSELEAALQNPKPQYNGNLINSPSAT